MKGIRLKGIKVVRSRGKRYVYRRVAGELIPLPDFPEISPEFLAAYMDAEKSRPDRESRGKSNSTHPHTMKGRSYE